jgi:hypothetical protein
MSAATKSSTWAFFGTLAVLFIWAISAAANFWAGYSLAPHDDVMKFVFGGASIAIDVLKAVSLFVVVGALANRRPVAALVAVILFAACSVWSTRSAIYASSTVFGTADAERQMSETLKQSQVAVLDIVTKRAQFLSQQNITIAPDAVRNARRSSLEVTRDENKRTDVEYKEALAQMKIEQAKLKEIKAAPPKDPIAWLFDLDSAWVIQMTCLGFALLLEVVSGCGLWLIAQARSPKPGRESRSRASSEPSGGEKALPPAEPKVFSAPNVVSLPVPSKLQPRNMLAEAVRDVVEPSDGRDRVLVSVVRSRAAARLPAGFDYCSHQNISMIVNELHPAARKRKTGGQMYFYGLKLKTAVAPENESRQLVAL